MVCGTFFSIGGRTVESFGNHLLYPAINLAAELGSVNKGEAVNIIIILLLPSVNTKHQRIYIENMVSLLASLSVALLALSS